MFAGGHVTDPTQADANSVAGARPSGGFVRGPGEGDTIQPLISTDYFIPRAACDAMKMSHPDLTKVIGRARIPDRAEPPDL